MMSGVPFMRVTFGLVFPHTSRSHMILMNVKVNVTRSNYQLVIRTLFSSRTHQPAKNPPLPGHNTASNCELPDNLPRSCGQRTQQRPCPSLRLLYNGYYAVLQRNLHCFGLQTEERRQPLHFPPQTLHQSSIHAHSITPIPEAVHCNNAWPIKGDGQLFHAVGHLPQCKASQCPPHPQPFFIASLPDLLHTQMSKLLNIGTCTATKIPFMYSFSGNSAASASISTSCVCEQFIYTQEQSSYFLQQNRQTDGGNI